MSVHEGNIVLVGVAGVGKTTIGERTAGRMGMRFIDVDLAFEEAAGADIPALIQRYGDEDFDKRLLGFFENSLSSCFHTLLAAPARLTHLKAFWRMVRRYAVSVHLRGIPDEVYRRQDVWAQGQRLSEEEKQEEQWIDEFKAYHRWRVRHCGKADHVVRIVGEKEKDTQSLCRLISTIIPAKTKRDDPDFNPDLETEGKLGETD